MTLLIVLTSVTAYFAFGALYARSQAVPLYRRYRAAHAAKWADSPGIGDRWSALDESHARSEVHIMLVAWVLFWPVVGPFVLLRTAVGGWVTAPLDDRRARAAQLREEAKAWRAKRHDGTPAERAMAAELARMCDDRAQEIDL